MLLGSELSSRAAHSESRGFRWPGRSSPKQEGILWGRVCEAITSTFEDVGRALFDTYLPRLLNWTSLMANRGFCSAYHSFWVSLLEQNVNSTVFPPAHPV